jgi:hypothetical protein
MRYYSPPSPSIQTTKVKALRDGSLNPLFKVSKETDAIFSLPMVILLSMGDSVLREFPQRWHDRPIHFNFQKDGKRSSLQTRAGYLPTINA